MKKNVLLIGAGRFGKHMAMQLNQLGHQVMAVDTDENRINDVMNIVTILCFRMLRMHRLETARMLNF